MTSSEGLDQFIFDWLSAIQDSSPPDPFSSLHSVSKHPQKRLLSPPMTDSNGSPSKRPRPDPDATPRKTYPMRPSDTVSLSSSGLSDANSATSESLPKRARTARSGNSSPTKKGLSAMRMDRIVTHPSFNGSEPLPDALDAMVQDITRDTTN